MSTKTNPNTNPNPSPNPNPVDVACAIVDVAPAAANTICIKDSVRCVALTEMEAVVPNWKMTVRRNWNSNSKVIRRQLKSELNDE